METSFYSKTLFCHLHCTNNNLLIREKETIKERVRRIEDDELNDPLLETQQRDAISNHLFEGIDH